MQKKLPITLFIIAIGFVCAILIIATGYSYWNNAQQNAINNFISTSDELNKRLSSELSNVVNIAANNSFLAAKSPLLEASIKDPTAVPALQKSWENMFLSASSLHQIRFLDINGFEVFRGNRTKEGIQWVAQTSLQDKSANDYFTNGIAGSHQIYLSDIDLNKENGVIEQPLRPTIRASAKFYTDGQIAGLVVLNFDLSEAFEFFEQQQSIQSHWIVNDSGFFISAPTNSEWGWLLNRSESNVEDVFPTTNTRINFNFDNIPVGNKAGIFENGLYQTTASFKARLPDVAQSDSQFFIVSQMSSDVYNNLRYTAIIIVAIILVLFAIIFVVAKYIDGIALAIQKSELLATELAQKAEASERTKANFLAQMSHEIRTPMNGMYGLLQLTQGEQDHKKINENLDQAVSSFKILKRIIDDILDFSKIEAGKLTLVQETFRIDVMLREVAQIMGRAGYGKNLDIWIDVDPQCPREVIGDAVRVNQILFNLANNAIKFTESGEIKLQISMLKNTDNNVVLGFALSDTGIGMSELEVSQVFEAFTQASDKTHSKFGGTGLGLSIVKQLIEMMNGHISIDSEPNKGTTFTFSLSFAKSPSSVPFKELQHDDSKVFYETLLLGFNNSALQLVKKQCAILGWTSQTISDIDNIKFAESDGAKRQVLIVDENVLNDDNAKQILIKCINNQPSMVKVLVASYGSDYKNAPEFIEFNNVINKPFTPSTLYDAVVTFSPKTVDNNQAASKTNSEEEQVLTNCDVLLVEDNEINQMVFTAMLESAGANVDIANNGKEAIDKMSNMPYSIVCMDIQMPVMDGVTATKIIRMNSDYDHIPIVALTANALEEDRKLYIELGMQRHISKPVERADFVNTIAELSL